MTFEPTWLDRIIGVFSPAAAYRRVAYRALMRYRGAQPSRYRNPIPPDRPQNQVVAADRIKLRSIVRDFERNHDIARGIITTLVGRIVGTGIEVDPQPLTSSGNLDQALARRITDAWNQWCESPEMSGLYDMSRLQQVACRAWLRDGEVFAQLVSWNRTAEQVQVPFGIELIETDWLSSETDEAQNAFDGIVVNNWRRPVAYLFYKRSVNDQAPTTQELVRIPAERILHLALRDHVGQLRGVPLLASAIERLRDLADYEESERLAAKVASAMTAAIKRGSPDMFDPTKIVDGEREWTFKPGQIYELAPGESIDVIDTRRPNSALFDFRRAMLKAVAAGTGAPYSSIARDYEGSYSSQRQELVEQSMLDQLLAHQFTVGFVRPIYREFLRHATAVGVLPAGDLRRMSNAVYLTPTVPWIDPLKEAQAWVELDKAGYVSPQYIMRKLGLDPDDVRRQREEWDREPTGQLDVKTAAPASNEPAGRVVRIYGA